MKILLIADIRNSKKFVIRRIIKMSKLTTVDIVALVLLVVGGLNWGLVGIADTNLVDMIFGVGSMLSRLIYIVVGVAALYVAWLWMKLERK